MLELIFQKKNMIALSQTRMEKSYLNLLPSQTAKKDLKPYFKELNLFEMVKDLNKTSPSEFVIKQSCFSFETSIPT